MYSAIKLRLLVLRYPMDEKFLEQADALTASMIEKGIQASRHREPPPADFDGLCQCGDEIPSARVAMGYYRCVPCQNRIELKGRRR